MQPSSTLTSKFSPKNWTFTTRTKFRHNTVSQTQNLAPMRNFFPLSCTLPKAHFHHAIFFTSQTSALFPATLYQKTSGHCLGTFRALKGLYPVTVINLTRLNTSPILLLLLFILLLLLFLLLRASSLKVLVQPVQSYTRAHIRDGRKNALRHTPATSSKILFLPFLI